ncbi:hypothetical protein EG68_10853, partial [Paragonimus skrjabini miyazakii]
RRLCAEGFTDDSPGVREQRIVQQVLEGTRDPSTPRAFLTAAPTSIQEASDRAGTIEQVNGVLERHQRYRTSEIAPVQYRPLVRPQPFNRQERCGPQRMQRLPYQKPRCYYCSLYGKRAYRYGHNRGVSATRPLSKLICPSFLLNNSHVRSSTVSGLLWSAPSVLVIDTGAACCLINKHRVPRQVLPQQDSGVRLVAANGTDIRSIGWLNVPVTLGEKVREHPMLVVDNLPWDATLGVDFLTTLQGGHIKTQSTPTPLAPEKFPVGDNVRRWEFQAKEYIFPPIQAERARVLATLLDREALDMAIDEGILEGDITEGTFQRLRTCFTTDPHRLEVCRQFHGRIQHPGEKLAAFIQELRRLCAEGFTDDTPEVREQRILQQALEGTRDPSTPRAFLTAAPTSIQEASDRAGTIEQ